jgi:DNA repair exonuclease SbcCD nuclease subunit
MKFLLLSDVHLVYQNPVARLDDLVEAQFEKLKFILKTVKEEDCQILQSGDLFDRPRSWILLPRVMDLLKEHKIGIYSIYGQHDTYLYSEETRDKTNLGILEKAGLVKILGSKAQTLIDQVGRRVHIYGTSFGGEIPIVKKSKDFNILVIHAPISMAPLYPGHEFTQAKKFLRANNFDLILCGDIHQAFLETDLDRNIINVGPMLRKEATEYNFKHKPGFVIFDTETKEGEFVEIPHRLAEEVLSRQHIDRKDEMTGMLQDFIESMKEGGEEQGVSFNENLQAFIRANGIDKDVVNCLSDIMGEGK